MRPDDKRTFEGKHSDGLRETGTPSRSMQLSRFVRRLPLLIGILFGLLWAAAFLALERLHGMGRMFEKEFPFFIAPVLGLHMGNMPWWLGAIAAFVDGAL